MKQVITILIFIALFATAMYYAGLQSDKQYCRDLQTQSEQYKDFYITQDDNELCNELGLEIFAPIK